MEKEIHNANSYKHSSEYDMLSKEFYEYENHESEKGDYPNNSSFYELLEVPTLGNIETIFFFDGLAIHSLKILGIAISRTRASESLTERVTGKTLDTDLHSLYMPLS